MPDTGEIELIRIAYNAEAALYCRGSRTEISLWQTGLELSWPKRIRSLSKLWWKEWDVWEEVDLAPPRSNPASRLSLSPRHHTPLRPQTISLILLGVHVEL